MKSDFETMPLVAAAACGKMNNSELFFTFPEVRDVIMACTGYEIAVLGVEIFEVRADGYYTENLSAYDSKMVSWEAELKQDEWVDYVKTNNARAHQFVLDNPTGDDHVYVLTTVSWREHLEIRENKRRRN
jgi:hypothetical protein